MNCLICLLITLLCASSTLAQDKPVDANRERAELLWEEAIRAKGGRARLHAIENFVVSSTIDIHGPERSTEVTTERLYAMPGKAWVYEYTPTLAVSLVGTVINMERDLCTVTLAPVGPMRSVPGLSFCLPTVWSERLIQDPLIYLMETNWVRPVPVNTRTEGKGKKQQDVIETEVGKSRADFYLDRKTHLPVKVITDRFDGDPRLTTPLGTMVTFEDYVDVDGVQMPRRVIREALDLRDYVGIRVARRDTERAKYRFNVVYNEEIFNFPVSKKAKAGDWQR